MKKSINKKSKIYHFCIVFFQMIFIYKSFATGFRWSIEIVTIVPVIVSGCLLLFFFIFRKVKIKKKSLTFFLVLVAGNLLSSIIWNDITKYNFIFILILSQVFFISITVDSEEYWNQYINVMVIMCLYSLISIYFLKPVLIKSSISFFKTYTNKYNKTFYDLGFSFVSNWYGLQRNQGYFREPGVYQFYLILALIQVLSKRNNKNSYFKSIILVLTLITTASTAGLSVLGAIIIYYLLRKRRIRLKKLAISLLFIFLLFYVFLSTKYGILLKMAFEKLLLGTAHGSFATRIEGPINLIRETFSSPLKILFGSGFSHGLTNVINMNVFNKDDVTGTLFVLIMGLGVPLGTYATLLIFIHLNYLFENTYDAIFLFLCFFLSINSQNLIYDNLFWMFLFTTFSCISGTRKNFHIFHKKQAFRAFRA